jgi:uncharacterized protein with GYD domain
MQAFEEVEASFFPYMSPGSCKQVHTFNTIVGVIMPFFLYRGRYTHEAWEKLTKNPKDLSEVMKPSIEQFGGRVLECFVSATSGDPLGFVEFPDMTAAATWTLFMASQSGVVTAEITPLLTTKQALEAMRRAGAEASDHTKPW